MGKKRLGRTRYPQNCVIGGGVATSEQSKEPPLTRLELGRLRPETLLARESWQQVSKMRSPQARILVGCTHHSAQKFQHFAPFWGPVSSGGGKKTRRNNATSKWWHRGVSGKLCGEWAPLLRNAPTRNYLNRKLPPSIPFSWYIFLFRHFRSSGWMLLIFRFLWVCRVSMWSFISSSLNWIQFVAKMQVSIQFLYS